MKRPPPRWAPAVEEFMKLILVRHGTATLESVNPEKPLSDRGRAEVEKVAGFLKAKHLKVDRVWHSTKKRAIETAQILAEAAEAGGALEEVTGLGPNDPVQDLMEKISGYAKSNPEGTLMIAGHLPYLAKLAGYLVTRSETTDLMEFPTACAVCLEQEGDRFWRIGWIIHPGIIP
ncbi:MAG: phosphohistidine phosphatase SixA [Candidatus Omnitrophica bacterium]|nr:phosphohistidine phosphatase SixA [Candidatus Omnitrophota bacterium]